MSVEWSDAEREAADPWEVFVDTDGHNSIRGRSAEAILDALAPHVAAREAQAAAKALREAAEAVLAPSDDLRDASTCRVIAAELHTRADAEEAGR